MNSTFHPQMPSAVFAIARTTIAEAIRSKILYALLAFAIGLILLSAVLSDLTLGWQVRIVTDVSLSAITVAGTLLALLLGVGSVAGEVERRTAYPILGKPVTRGEFVLGKWLGVLGTTYLNVLLMMGAATAMVAHYSQRDSFDYPVAAYLATLLLTLLRLAVIAGIAVALSTFSSSTVALIASLGLTVAGYFTGELRFFLTKSENPVLPLLGKVLYYAIPDFASLDSLPRLMHGHPILPSEVAWAAAYAVFYALTVLVIACRIFSRRDLA